jgi:lipopolysaccharide export system protein LptA
MNLTGKRLLLLFLLCFTLSALFSAKAKAPKEEKFNLIHSDKLFLTKVNEENVMELYGNVHFFYGKTEFRSNRAYIYNTQKIARLLGNVIVSNDTMRVTADSLSYYRIPNKLNMGGNVIITEQKKTGVFNRFTSSFGTYDRVLDQVTATKNVTAFSQTEKARAKCDYAFWDRKNGYGYLLDNPQLWSEDKDTLYIRSEKMEFYDEDRKVIATFNVSAQSKDYTTTSDFLLYFLKEDKAVFLGEPKFTSGFADATAEEFYLYFNQKKLVKAELKDSCLVYFADEKGKPKVNWVKSQFIRMNLDGDNLEDFLAETNVRYHYVQEQEENKDYFANSATGSFLTASFDKEGKLDKMQMNKKVKGIYRFLSKP